MIFIAKADGTLSRVIPSAVNQGSVGVNELVLIAPYPKGSAVTAAFILPNGIRTKPNLATLTEIADFIEGEHYNAWVFELTAAITEYAGNVTVQFYVTSANGVLTTYSNTFAVAKGVMPEMLDAPTDDVYNQILTAYGNASARLSTAESDISSIKEDIGSESTYGTIKGRIYAAEMNTQNNTSEITQTKSRVSTNERGISAIEEAIGNDDTDGTVKGRIKTAEGDIDDLEDRATALEHRADEFESDFVIVDGRLVTLERNASTAATAISALQTSLKNFGIFNRAEYNKTTNTIILWFVKNGENQKVEIPLEDFLNADELEDEIAAQISALTQEYQASIEQSEANARASATAAKSAQTAAESAARKAEGHESRASEAAVAANTFSASAREARDEAVTAREEAQAASAEARESARKAEMYSQTSEDRWSVFDKRLTNVENGISADPFVTDDSVAYQKTAPASALPFAALERVGGMSYVSRNLFNIDATPTWNTNTRNTLTKVDEVTFTSTNSNNDGGGNGIYVGTFDAGVTITVSGYFKTSSTDFGFIDVITPRNGSGSLTKEYGPRTEFTYFFHTYTTKDTTREYYYRPAYTRSYSADHSITLKNVQIEVGSTATTYMPYFDGIRNAAVTGIESEGANLARTQNGIYPLGTTNQVHCEFADGAAKVVFNGFVGDVSSTLMRPYTRVLLPAGTYTATINYITAPFNTSLYLTNEDTGETISTKGTAPGDNMTKTFTLTEPHYVSWSCYFYNAPTNGEVNGEAYVTATIVRGSTALPYSPYFKETFTIPTTLTSLPYYGYGINADVNNHIDYENTEYVQMCSVRAYRSGDENNPEVVTDGTKTVYALSTPVRTPITFTDNYIRVGGSGTLTFVNEHKMAVPSTVLYLTKEASV